MPKTDSENAREVLRTAFAAKDIAKVRLQTAIDAVDRAKMFLTEPEDHLRSFADVDEKLSAYRADKIKEWSVSGGERPSLDLPADLAVAREAASNGVNEKLLSSISDEALTDLTELKARFKFLDARQDLSPAEQSSIARQFVGHLGNPGS
jgi:hypothetical protein